MAPARRKPMKDNFRSTWLNNHHPRMVRSTRSPLFLRPVVSGTISSIGLSLCLHGSAPLGRTNRAHRALLGGVRVEVHTTTQPLWLLRREGVASRLKL